jgi:tetratricopeptide (TPR) repeat protein
MFGAVAVFLFSFFLFSRRASRGNKKQPVLPALADNRHGALHEDKLAPSVAGPPPLQAFIKDLVANAQTRGVPVAALQTVLAGFLEAGIDEEDIPGCLLAAAVQLGELRARLAERPLHGRVEEASAKALACIDAGDFDAAIGALQQAREAGWTALVETHREEAELYAKEAQIEHLRSRFRDAGTKYAAAAALILESGDGDAWPYLAGQAREFCDEGRASGNRESLLLAVSVCHGALGLVTRAQSPDKWAAAKHKWAATKHCLGQALFALGARHNEPDRLGAAIDAYLAALEEWTQDCSPRDWARAQNDLGDALHALNGQRDDLRAMQDAAAAYKAALTQWQQEAAPFEWARAFKSLGDALAIVGIGEDQAERLIDAVDAYKQALKGTSREFAPAQWAFTQMALGEALQALGEKESGSGRLHQAVSAYRAAMQEGVLSPSIIAAANDNLGDALVMIGERENSLASLKQAACAYRAALKAQPAEAPPLDTARTQTHLAYALGALWNRTRNPQCLEEALGAADAALSILEEAGAREQLPDAERAREAILAAMGKGKADLAAA